MQYDGTCGTMQVALLGTSRQTSPLDLRERLAFSPGELGMALDAMKASVAEGVILSTCHRVELYAAAPGTGGLRAALIRYWARQRGVSAATLTKHVYYAEGEDAARHLFAVAAGLDSAIVGEPQILGQVRDAVEQGEAHGAGPVLGALFHRALAAGKRARSETGVGRNATSISSAAVELARRTFGDLRASRVLLVGTGKMGELAAKNLLARGVGGLAVAGRTPERARKLALECGSAVALSELEEALPRSDIVISCTSAPHHVIRREMVERVMRGRRGRPLFLIDIAVPRDIDPAVAAVPGVRLYNVDDLETAVAANVRARRVEAHAAARIVEAEAAGFAAWLAARRAVPTIAALHERAEAIRRAELARTSSVLRRLPDADRVRIESLTLALEKKLLHHAITRLRAEAEAGDGREADRAVRALFALDP
ncbi:MAG: glutamyl-tRNA reductase [Chloroflexota bacterium]|nr:glutamyl-tRNA reductase [Chloroflexota bacterium]